MIKPEQRTHVIQVYVTKTEKGVIRHEAKKRGISISALLKIGIFDYFNPKVISKSDPIVRIDRTPKGSTTFKDSKALQRPNDYKECIEELKQVFAKRRRINNERT
ncbi:hypothetical protein LCGC14_0567120 [marine sediment metagenome]|uniref:Uncharacterized protein n=1 Tax=marine sediment metagenome TaxID=412755 RepID=A0A0F9RKA2_9ZZZZ